ncbi:glycosyltransferase family 2 protein [Bacillus sp. SG-1]|uniref:glycosyltransferase family 2 protein n=1 Tax=Bacillus sp. SG-1 TaxID=161544 RepID=UPI00015432AC|nr:glycosyltransferase family 2 protein [Bacillus sp. SG-1]EDL65255.1 putative LPS biosynthesis related glycosyltransferase [Bacillus sp. SG-1]
MQNDEKNQYGITIFTATYNRAYIIDQLYESLKKQTVKDFEWIIIDDGSTDNTLNLLEEWKHSENNFTIRFVQTQNGGKHRAINIGMEMSNGELFFIVDSDDHLPETAIETILRWYPGIKDHPMYAGLGGLKAYRNGSIVGRTFNGEYVDATSLERIRLRLIGDKAEIFKTKIVKEYKFPEIENEKFIPEGIIWNRIANDGLKIRWFNEVVYLCEYLEDGLTSNSDTLLLNNFEGYTLYIKENMTYYNICNPYLLRILTAYVYRAKKKGLTFREIQERIQLNRALIIILHCIGKAHYSFKDRLYK